jgi:hypothetical protein
MTRGLCLQDTATGKNSIPGILKKNCRGKKHATLNDPFIILHWALFGYRKEKNIICSEICGIFHRNF